MNERMNERTCLTVSTATIITSTATTAERTADRIRVVVLNPDPAAAVDAPALSIPTNAPLTPPLDASVNRKCRNM